MDAPRKSQLPSQSPDVRLRIARADAIESYSGLEIALCRLFAHVLGTKVELAGIVFFRITSARARNSTADALIKRKYGAKFNLFWNSIFKMIGQLDNKRNEIVHWRTNIQPNFNRAGRLTSVTAKLRPPNLWDRRRHKPSLDERDLNDFALKCEFVDAAIWSFVQFAVSGRRGGRKQRAAWRGIFQRPLTYPPPHNHPICMRWPKRQVLLVPVRS